MVYLIVFYAFEKINYYFVNNNYISLIIDGSQQFFYFYLGTKKGDIFLYRLS